MRAAGLQANLRRVNGGRRAACEYESTTLVCLFALLTGACAGQSVRHAEEERQTNGGSTSGSAGTANTGTGGESARGGGGVGTAGAANDGEWRCEGTPTPCSTLDAADCFGAECKLGACVLDGDPCGGTDDDTCDATQGCSSDEGFCRRSSYCSLFDTSPTYCEAEEGCSFSGDARCFGERKPCETLIQEQCWRAPGCSLGICMLTSNQCTGCLASSCAGFSNACSDDPECPARWETFVACVCERMSVRDGPGVDRCRADLSLTDGPRNLDACAENYCRRECYGGR